MQMLKKQEVGREIGACYLISLVCTPGYIGVTELYFIMSVTVKSTYKNFPVYFIGCVIYFLLTFTITRIIKLIEKKLRGKKHYSLYTSNAIGELNTSAGGSR